MIRTLRLLLGLVALIVIVAFAIANRTPVDVSFAPLPVLVELPLYGVFLLGLTIGVLVGGIGVWLGGLAERHRAKRLRSRVWALENQLRLQKQQEEKARAERYTAQKAHGAAGRGRLSPPARIPSATRRGPAPATAGALPNHRAALGPRRARGRAGR